MEPIRVLLVDDDPDFRAVLRAMLQLDDRFQVVDEGADGRQAIALANLHQPDVVLLDLMMPELDGVTAAAELRTEAPGTLIVMLSSRDARAAERTALASGVDLFIEKHRLAEVGDLLDTLVESNRV